MRSVLFLIFVSWLLTIAVQSSGSNAQNDTTYIFLKDYGLYKTKKRNAIKHFYKSVEDLKGDEPKVLVFSTGTYHFYPDGCKTKVYYETNTSEKNPKICAFYFEDINNLVIDGRGSHLIFHQEMQPFTFDNCKNITLKNVNIDWEQPLIAQAEVLRLNDNYMDIGLDPKESPYRLIDGKVFFEANNGEQHEWKSTIEFDRRGRYIVPQTGEEGCLGEDWNAYHAEPTMPGIVRLHFNFKRDPQIGNFLIMRHTKSSHAGVYIVDSENITINNLKIFHATGTGILAQKSKNLTFTQLMAIPNRAKNRYFSGSDKGLEVVNCTGQIWINNCTFHGLMEEAVDVSTTSALVSEIVDTGQIKCSLPLKQDLGLDWAKKGDKINYVEDETKTVLGTNIVKEVVAINETSFILQLEENVPPTVEHGDILQNVEQQAELTVENSNFKSCDGHGMQFSAINNVTIQNNLFESSGSAILIGANTNKHYKSGSVDNVLIKGNIFSSYCNSSSYQKGEAIISIYPIIQNINEDTPALIRNIRIENNEFNPFDYPLLYALSLDNLSFKANQVIGSNAFAPFNDRLHNFSFDYCNGINISENDFSEELLGKNILLKKTPNNQLNTDLMNSFSVEQY